ncbi:Exosome complex exonuclease [Komagataella phaffii CBS 7435]|uniref:Exonuclease component of the nuclear exosome n=2 Tax=Komagataella phaffii TaxID=460519 RepID=C4QXG4_KOMPG|nr:Exonuclease component of the nuclear exosome [Komagataella phaffii GS115]AOA61443.1 GQ67_02076T0 [Komagataella phaffii]CAH2446750.1 Exosome complex exonuclease [Komagataella phaffii CBS 7435]AOA66858.1 GQ68_02091T0 [Komagataella phaffii GS115]CAY67937.1 Exonuclease component of the nuclear exosome [Komagataella phaffii GS115]CCA37015.1 Exosome complex exonuclease [Komagataella phaffii CBS 7435]
MKDKVEGVQELFPELANAIRIATAIEAQDIKFYESLDKSLEASVTESSKKLISLTNKILTCLNAKTLKYDPSNIDTDYTEITNGLDSLCERVDILLDKASKPSSTNDVKYLEDSISKDQASRKSSKDMIKPQIEYNYPIDNTESNPFRPLLNQKYNSVVPFEEVHKLVPETDDNPQHHNHPYEFEINSQEYPKWILERREPIVNQPWESTTAIYVETEQQVGDMIDTLSKADVIAVDLEHHDLRTYYGLVCLMQISTRNQDYIVDTLKLRFKLQPLNKVFTDPSIVKVFHGAFMDIIWLQRDLGLYVVSLFDTFHASKLLGFPKHSLAYLLETYAKFKTSKKYQLADWRVRPLTKPLLAYARSDTHFLLYIFDQLNNMLIESGKLSQVLYDSRQVALRRFEYTKFRPNFPTPLVVSPLNDRKEPWKQLLYLYNIPRSRQPVFIALYNWRDEIAREDDESTRYVLPNQLLATITSISPTDVSSLMSCSNIRTPYLKKYATELVEIIKSTLKEGAENQDVKSLTSNGIEKKAENVDYQTVLNSDRLYSHLMDSQKQLDNEALNLLIQDSRILLHSSNVAVSYSKNNVSEESLDERGTSQVLKILAPQALVVSESENEEEEVKTPETKAEPEKEDPREVIVLNRSARSKPQPVVPEVDDQPPLDFAGADKVMLEIEPRKKPKQSRKKRSFDPYAQSNKDPHPEPKKHAKFNENRSAVFKK